MILKKSNHWFEILQVCCSQIKVVCSHKEKLQAFDVLKGDKIGIYEEDRSCPTKLCCLSLVKYKIYYKEVIPLFFN